MALFESGGLADGSARLLVEQGGELVAVTRRPTGGGGLALECPGLAREAGGQAGLIRLRPFPQRDEVALGRLLCFLQAGRLGG